MAARRFDVHKNSALRQRALLQRAADAHRAANTRQDTPHIEFHIVTRKDFLSGKSSNLAEHRPSAKGFFKVPLSEFFNISEATAADIVERMKHRAINARFECCGCVLRRTDQATFEVTMAVPLILNDITIKLYHKQTSLPVNCQSPNGPGEITIYEKVPFLWYEGPYPCVYQFRRRSTSMELELELVLSIPDQLFKLTFQDLPSVGDLLDCMKWEDDVVRYFPSKPSYCSIWSTSSSPPQLTPLRKFTWRVPLDVERSLQHDKTYCMDRNHFLDTLLYTSQKRGRSVAKNGLVTGPVLGKSKTFEFTTSSRVSGSKGPETVVDVQQKSRYGSIDAVFPPGEVYIIVGNNLPPRRQNDPAESGSLPQRSVQLSRMYFHLPKTAIDDLVKSMIDPRNHSEFQCGGRIFRRVGARHFAEVLAAPERLDRIVSGIIRKEITLPHRHSGALTMEDVLIKENTPFLWLEEGFTRVYRIWVRKSTVRLELLLSCGWGHVNLPKGELPSLIDLITCKAWADGQIGYFPTKPNYCYTWQSSLRQLVPSRKLTWQIPPGIQESDSDLQIDRSRFVENFLNEYVRRNWDLVKHTIQTDNGDAFTYKGEKYMLTILRQSSWPHTDRPAETVVKVERIVKGTSTSAGQLSAKSSRSSMRSVKSVGP